MENLSFTYWIMHLNYKTENQILHMVDLQHDKKGKLYEVCDRFHSYEYCYKNTVSGKKIYANLWLLQFHWIYFSFEHFRCNKKN